MPRDALTIAFIDNLGWDVSLSTISRIAADRRMDLIVTFQISALTRNVQQALKDPAIGTQWDAHLVNGWRKAVADFEVKRTQAPNVGAALADYYADRLSKLGYKYRQQLNDTMKNTRNATLYRVMCFSKHQLGGKLFGAVSKSVDAPTLNFEG